MKTYISKPYFVKVSEVKKAFSFNPGDYRKLNYKNNNIKLLSEIVKENVKGFEPGSSEYVNFGENYFVRISEMNDLNFTFGISKDTKKIRPTKNLNIIKDGDLCYQTASNVGNVCFYKGPNAYYNSHIRKLHFENNLYIFAILKSSFGKEQISVSGSIKGVDNFRKELLENIKIPFPSKNNHKEPEKIENLVSLIVQNLIDKEEQIKRKNILIDEMIERELRENQREKDVEYSFPRISEIMEIGRLDAGLFNKEFKNVESLILNYKNGFDLFKEIKKINSPSGKTFNYLENYKSNNLFITSRNIQNGVFNSFIKFFTKEKVITAKGKSILIGRVGSIESIIVPENFEIAYNDNMKLITIINEKYNTYYIGKYLNSKISKTLLSNMISKVNGGLINDFTLNNLLIPNFPNQKQEEIAREYYNNVEKIVETKNFLSLQNYLQTEKERNKQLGIFQINMEIFSLREELENIIDKIIINEKIDIIFEN